MKNNSTKESEEIAFEIEKIQTRELILYNDDFNTFDHVINCLVSICNHSSVQAEQCAFIVHHNGKCSIKCGEVEKLEPILTALKRENLTAEIK